MNRFRLIDEVSLILTGPTRHKPVLDPLAVHHLFAFTIDSVTYMNSPLVIMAILLIIDNFRPLVKIYLVVSFWLSGSSHSSNAEHLIRERATVFNPILNCCQ